jgi:hypothetical protein
MRLSVKYITIIVAFLVLSQQGAWMPLDVENFGGFGASRVVGTLADLAAAFAQAVADHGIDLPHTRIVVN